MFYTYINCCLGFKLQIGKDCDTYYELKLSQQVRCFSFDEAIDFVMNMNVCKSLSGQQDAVHVGELRCTGNRREKSECIEAGGRL
jgi:maltoporin